jgi:hypothetical protein
LQAPSATGTGVGDGDPIGCGRRRPRARRSEVATSCMVSGGRSLPVHGGFDHLVVPAGRALGWPWCWSGRGGSFLAGDQSGDRGQDRVEVLASAEVTGQDPPVLQVADAVLDADPLRRVSPAVGLMRRGSSASTSRDNPRHRRSATAAARARVLDTTTLTGPSQASRPANYSRGRERSRRPVWRHRQHDQPIDGLPEQARTAE